MLFDLTLEQDLLASAITWIESEGSANAKILMESTTVDDFYNSTYREVYNLIKKALSKKILPVQQNLENIGCSEKVKGCIYELESHRTFTDIKPFIKRLKVIAKSRRLCMVTDGLQKIFNEDIEEIEESYQKAEEQITTVLKERISADQGHFMKDRLGNYFENLDKLIEQKKEPGIPTGIKKFDEITGGLRPTESVLVAGRPGMGKSSLALSIIAHLILNGYKPAYFSLELSETEIFNKLFSIISEMLKIKNNQDESSIIRYRWLRNPKTNKKILNRLGIIAGMIYESFFYYNCDPYQDINEIKSICRELKYGTGLDIAIIDHFGRMVKDHRQEYAELTHMSSESKNLAIELDFVTMPLVQLRRDSEKSGMPSLSHLKGTGAFEEDSDIVLFPWRPYIINKEQHQPEEAILITGKARNDLVPNVNMRFSTDTTLFSYNPDVIDGFGEED